jgi:hypothetical protein
MLPPVRSSVGSRVAERRHGRGFLAWVVQDCDCVWSHIDPLMLPAAGQMKIEKI